MKLFPTLMRALASLGAPVAVLVVSKLLEVFQGAQPSDVSAPVWVILSGVLVFALNLVLSKIPKPQ